MVIELSIEDGIATILLNRPDKYNAMIREMALALQDTLDQCDKDENVRCIVIKGAGQAFCAGQDLNEVVDPEGPELQNIVQEHFNPIIMRIREIEKPIVAAVNGVAAGAGANIAVACDLTIAKESASFIQAFSKIGLIPDSGGTFFLPRIVGMQKATALMFLGYRLSAQEAVDLNMIYKVVVDDQFEKEVKMLASELALLPTRALGLTKRALNKSMSNELEKQLAIEGQLQFAASQTEDYAEGVNAFLEKRKAVFKGK
jgi:2-(1,2-epoxy-1,2-dihydrophenyl)acetyl-CoA isomerase